MSGVQAEQAITNQIYQSLQSDHSEWDGKCSTVQFVGRVHADVFAGTMNGFLESWAEKQ